MTTARIDQHVREALVQTSSGARVDQQVREAFVQVSPGVRVDQLVREMWVPLDVVAVNQVIRESWVSTTVEPVVTIPCQPSIEYYLSLITSQYQGKTKFLAWLRSVLTLLCQLNACVRHLNLDFDIDLAVGAQLDALGEVIGDSRTVSFQPAGVGVIQSWFIPITNRGANYHQGDVLDIIQPGASGGKLTVSQVSNFGGGIVAAVLSYPGTGYTIASGLTLAGGSGTGAKVNITAVSAITSTVLDDDTYRVLLKAKIAQNQWDGQLSSLYAIWQDLFPGGIIAVQDNQNMTATIFLVGSFSSIIQDLITNGLIVPRPEGVLYNYVFALLPVFGFDGDHTFIAGFDEGHWA